jgi:protein-S-isoprenylcysteine O-methyltransferase Ste14
MHGIQFGWPIMVLGISIVLWCVRDFYVIGKGTLAPWDPPRKLVVVGLYKLLRNPMYVGVLGFLAGWTLLAGSPVLAVYTLVVALAFHLRVVLYEEPTLARLFVNEWAQYRKKVNRWIPTFRRNITTPR